jgi:glycosyltransferase involved in cell wall biosynthesis
MKIAIITDAWSPQINGVVKTLEQTVRCLQAAGHDVLVIEPSRFRTMACPGYDEIRLSILPYWKLSALLSEFSPDAIHVATEGPLGFAARRYALKHGLNFTTAYHTKFPEYLEARTGIHARHFYPVMRWFHSPAKAVMVSTDSVIAELQAKGFTNLVKWSRGVDMALFDAGLPRTGRDDADPVFLYVGRISVEKNIEAFLDLPLPGEKWLVGDGPALETLSERYPSAVFFGAKTHAELAEIYRMADVFVFPSKTDTFGLVLLEAMASGLPVAAYPVAGPRDVLAGCEAAALRSDLLEACMTALDLDPKHAVAHARKYSWQSTTGQFIRNLYPNMADSAVRKDRQPESRAQTVLSR